MSPAQRPNMPEPPPSPSSSSIFALSYLKLQFFARVRRFLQTKRAQKSIKTRTKAMVNKEEQATITTVDRQSSDVDDDSVVLQRSVKKLHFGSWEEKEVAALEIEKLAREDAKMRNLMAELGVILALVGMVASEVAGRQRMAINALIELANGNYKNKALMVEAGIFSKLPKSMDALEEPTRQKFAELILSLSSLANHTQFPLASSEVLPFLIGILESCSSYETKESCLSTLYNLSAVLDNAGPLLSNGAVQTLLRVISEKEFSEKALATLGHLVVTLMGKKAMENSSLVPESLIEIMTWEDKPKCQELSAYILMILAHQSSALRDKMLKSGIVPVLLEVALLGSPLAQKRALKLLQWFKDERQTRMGPHSGPQTARIAIGSPVNNREAQEGKKLMKDLVKQSLHKNMELITRRANATSGDSSKFKSLVISTSSKSLPC
ncbi:PREDICTED: U-box domain-containing protein 7-like [Populus euphratica]|uniref:U-box domain-containing protein 7-like n=1 Tax=Populus euphratica TaxID=75702 RepID=A0AAJ6T6E7_POPEU|nr:PREDICTED: U-box domain-containing protein 7-like [Populus euphratica]